MGLKICFYGEIWVIIPKICLSPPRIWSSVCCFVSHSGSEEYRCPPNSRDGGTLKIYNSKCYQFIKYELHWHHARQFCLDRGADLITIHRRDIQTFVERSLREIGWSNNGMWIGATDEQDERNWKWVTGREFNLNP